MSKTKAAPVDLSAQPFHFFGSTCLYWEVGQTREEVIEKLAKRTGADTIRRSKTGPGSERGFYVWVCRVNVPQTQPYNIDQYRPVGVFTDDAREYDIISANGNCREIFNKARNPVTEALATLARAHRWAGGHKLSDKAFADMLRSGLEILQPFDEEVDNAATNFASDVGGIIGDSLLCDTNGYNPD